MCIEIFVQIIQIACGTKHALVLTSERDVYAFGRNKAGQLGLGDFRDRTKPEKVPSLPSDVHIIGAGPRSSFCSTLQGDVYQWGEINKEIDQKSEKPLLHFSFDSLRQAQRSKVLTSILDIDQRIIDPDKIDTIKDQVEARNLMQNTIIELENSILDLKEDVQTDDLEMLDQHEAADELHEMVRIFVKLNVRWLILA